MKDYSRIKSLDVYAVAVYITDNGWINNACVSYERLFMKI